MAWVLAITFLVLLLAGLFVEGFIGWTTERLAEAEKHSRFRKPIRIAAAIGILVVLSALLVFAYYNSASIFEGIEGFWAP
ncbi:MAG: hypothetical protein AAGB29_04705 [Planctomycetota bacterium]